MKDHMETVWVHNDGKWDRGIGYYSRLRPEGNNGTVKARSSAGSVRRSTVSPDSDKSQRSQFIDNDRVEGVEAHPSPEGYWSAIHWVLRKN